MAVTTKTKDTKERAQEFIRLTTEWQHWIWNMLVFRWLCWFFVCMFVHKHNNETCSSANWRISSAILFFLLVVWNVLCAVVVVVFLGAVFWKPNMEQNRLNHLSTKPNDLFMEPNALNIKHLDYPACPWVTLIDVHRMPKHTVASHKCENILQCWLEVYICFSLNLIAFQW